MNADRMTPDPNRLDQPLHSPLPYGSGFATTQPLGYGVGPADAGFSGSGLGGPGLAGQGLGGPGVAGAGFAGSGLAGVPGSALEVSEPKRAGSPVLAVAGLLSLAVAVWAILGGPVVTPTVLLSAGLVLTVLVGLVMVIRR